MTQNRLPFDYMPAAGWAKTVMHVAALTQVDAITHIPIGSFTVDEREGNVGGTNFAWLPDGTTVNAVGLKNGGVPYLRANGRDMAMIAHDGGKKLVVSGAWLKPEDSAILAETAFEIGADVYEDNCGCPNVFDGGKQKEVPSYRAELMEESDGHLRKAIGNQTWWKKLSPFVNPLDRLRLVPLIVKSGAKRLTVINTFGNIRLRGDDGKPLITAKGTDGYGGMAGTGAHWIGVANAEHFVELLGGHGIEVNGVGGVSDGTTAEHFRQVRCAGVQVGSAFFEADHPKVLVDIATDWVMKHHH